MVGGGWKVLHYIIAVIFLLGGLWAFIRPINTFFALASVLGLVLVLQGAFEIVRAVSSRDESPYWWLGLVYRRATCPARITDVLIGLRAPGAHVSDPVLGGPDGADPGGHVDRPRVHDPACRPIRGDSLSHDGFVPRRPAAHST
jgi:hypothetical protein